jgi:hypothetical protein
VNGSYAWSGKGSIRLQRVPPAHEDDRRRAGDDAELEETILSIAQILKQT